METPTFLAPSGRLRAAINLGNPVLAQRRADGTLGGVSVALAQRLAKALDVPLAPVVYDSAGKVTDAAGDDAWDVAFLAIDPKRAEQIAFTRPYVLIEATYLVPASSSLHRCEQVDAPGHVIVTSQGSAYDLHLRRTVKHATFETTGSPADAMRTFVSGSFTALAGVRLPLEKASTDGRYRVLADSLVQIRQAMAVSKSRDAAIPWLSDFVREAIVSGEVERALRESGQAEATIAPPDAA